MRTLPPRPFLLARLALAGLLALLVLASCTGDLTLPAATVRSIVPDEISSADGGDVTVHGSDFFQYLDGEGVRVEACGVSVAAPIVDPATRSILLPPAGRISVQVGDRITAAFPSEGLEPGVSDIRIVRPDGDVTVLEDAITCVAPGTEPEPETDPEPEPEPEPDPEPDPDPSDVVAPTVAIDRIEAGRSGGSVVVSGRAGDDLGIERVQMYLGSDLVGSSASADVDGGTGIAPIVFTDAATGAWEMAWASPPEGSYVLRAEAHDRGANRAVAYHGVDVAPPDDLEDITTFRTVASASGGDADPDATFEAAVDNCPATGFDLPGQGLQAVGAGLQAVGAVGGLFLGPPTAATTSGAAVGGRLADIVFGPTPTSSIAPQATVATTRVALLIVDDFAGAYELPPELLAGSVTAAELEAFAASGALSHGALVMHHALELLAGAGYAPQAASLNAETGEPYVTARHVMGHEVLVQAVDTDGFDTDGIPDRIERTLTWLHGREPVTGAPIAGSPGVLHAVVNLSFAVVPCAVTSDLDMSGLGTFEGYVDALIAVNGLDAVDRGTVTDVVTTPLGDDPMLAHLACPFPEENEVQGAVQVRCHGMEYFGGFPFLNLVHVAAAGNFGSPYPLYPATLDRVISVSSMDATATGHDTVRSGFSNAAEVMAPGAAFELATADGISVTYAGTSFAAPVVSVFSAIDIGVDALHPLCDPGDEFEDGDVPDLAHGTNDDTPLHATFGGGASAIADHCTPPI